VINVLHGTASGLPDQIPTHVTSVAGIEQIALGDFTGDGKMDVLGATGYGRAVVHAGDGAGNLGAPQDVPLVGYQNGAYATTVALAAADLDHNGVLDAVVADEGAGIIEVLRNGNAPPPAAPPIAPPVAPPPILPPLKALSLLSGLSGLAHVVKADAKGRLIFGRAANPTVVAVTLTLILPGTSAAAKHKAVRTIKLGTATIKLASRTSRPLVIKLSAASARLLRKRHSLRAILTIRATRVDGSVAAPVLHVTVKEHHA